MQVIVGEQLGAITFVQDYVQLAFDRAVLNAYVVPTVEVSGRTLRWNEAGYRDELCRRIARKVTAVRVRAHEAIEVALDDGALVRVSLRDEDLADGSAESAAFVGASHAPWIVFRPGDG